MFVPKSRKEQSNGRMPVRSRVKRDVTQAGRPKAERKAGLHAKLTNDQ